MSPRRSAAEVRAGLKHPIVDADGHWLEYVPVFAERMRKVAGDKAADGFLASQRRVPEIATATARWLIGSLSARLTSTLKPAHPPLQTRTF